MQKNCLLVSVVVIIAQTKETHYQRTSVHSIYMGRNTFKSFFSFVIAKPLTVWSLITDFCFYYSLFFLRFFPMHRFETTWRIKKPTNVNNREICTHERRPIRACLGQTRIGKVPSHSYSIYRRLWTIPESLWSYKQSIHSRRSR